MLDKQTIESLAAKAKDIRISTIREIAHLGNGHIGLLHEFGSVRELTR